MARGGGIFGGAPVQIQLETAGLGTSAKALKEAAKALKGNDIGSGLIKSIEDGSRELAKEFGDAAAKATNLLMGASATALKGILSDWDTTMAGNIAELDRVMREGSKLEQDQHIDKMKRDEEEFKKRFKQEGDLIEKRAKVVEKQVEAQKNLKEAASVKGATDAIEGGMSKAKGGDLSGGLEAAASAMETIGVAMGATAASMAAVVGVVALLVKMMIDAEAQAKEFNSTMMEGAGFADMAFSRNNRGLIEIGKSMGAVRDAAVNLGFTYRTLPKDMMAIVAAANQAGLTFKEIEKGTSDATEVTARYSTLLETSLVYSRALGVSTSEIAEQSAKWHHDFGMGLKRIEESFGAITQIAMQSGMSTKRFFGMVSQATSGMAIYNNRIEETAELLSSLASVIGEELADSLSQDLTKGFMNDSYQERFKKIIIAGGKDVSHIMSNSAKDTIRSFTKDFAGMDLSSILGKAGVAIDVTNPDQEDATVKALAKMSPEKMREALTDLRLAGKDEEAKRLETLIKISKGAEGSMGDQAKAMGALDAGATLAMKLQALGNRGLSEMNAMELAAFESYAGVSGEQLEALIRIDSSIRGQWEGLEAIKASGQEMSEDAKKKMAEEFGAVVVGAGKNAKIMSASFDGQTVTLGRELKSLIDMQQSKGDAITNAVDLGLGANEAMAAEVARQTTSISTVLEIGIQYWLEEIYKVMTVISGGIFDLDKTEAEVQAQMLHQNRQQTEQWRDDLAANQAKQSDLRIEEAQLSGDDKDGKALAKLKRIQLEMEQKKLQEQIAYQGEFDRNIRAVASWDAPDTLAEGWGEVEGDLLAERGRILTGTSTSKRTKDGLVETPDTRKAQRSDLNPMAQEALKAADQTLDGMADQTEALMEADGDFVKQQTESLTDADKEAYSRYLKDVPKSIAEKTGMEFLETLRTKDFLDLMTSAGVTDLKTQQAYMRKLREGAMPPELLAAIQSRAFETDTAGKKTIKPMWETLGSRTGFGDRINNANDFIYAGGQVTTFDRSQEFMATLKDGTGAIAQAAGGGGGKTININVSSPQDMERVYQVVKAAAGAP